MKNIKYLGMVAGAVIATAAVQQAQANLLAVQGTIDFNNANTVYTTDTGANLGTLATPATEFTSITGDTVTTALGTYAPALGDGVTFHVPIIYIPPTASLPFWTVDTGVDTFIFNADSMNPAQLSYAPNNFVSQVQLSGLGDVKEYADTDLTTVIGTGSGSWTLQAQDQGAGTGFSSLTFQSGASTVPDGGLSVALLGGALTAMSLVRSKLGKK